MTIPLVTILSIAYNHELYISQAIESWVMQKTNFKFEIVIGEDNSSDNTRSIIKNYQNKYPEIIKPLLRKENLGMLPNFIDTMKSCKGKYIALCEGDDYWTDPYKLQKQVDFLEANPEYALVAGGIALVDEHDQKLVPNQMLIEQQRRNITEPDFFDLLQGNLINTLTVCVRSEVIKGLSQKIIQKKIRYIIDYWFWLNIAITQKIFIANDIYAVYRVHNDGISRSSSLIKNSMSWIRFDTIKNFVNQKKIVSQDEKEQIFKAMLGLMINRRRIKRIKVYSFLWLLIHPSYLLAWLKRKKFKLDFG